MRKLLAIVWKENYERFTDRAGLLYMLAAPLALSIILGLAFSGLSGNSSDISISDIPVAIVNLDEGSAQARYGDIFVQAFVPPNPENEDPDNTLHHLFDAREMTDEAEARALVERGDLDAILVIPPDFSQSLTLDAAAFAGGPENVSLGGHAELTAYWNSGAQINWSIFRDVVQGIANGIANSNIAINVTVSGLIQANPLFGLQMATGAFNDTFAEIAQAASQPGANPINLRQVNVQGEEVGQQFDPLQYFGPAFAIFFTGFTAVFGAASVLQEQRDWTLQRMIVTPTPSLIILAGKMIAAFVGGVLQMVMLIVSMTLIASLLRGEFTNIWGDDLLGVALLTLAVVAAGTGIGAILAGIVKTNEQANNFGSLILIIMGMISGTFFALPENPALTLISRLTFHWWGREGFTMLSNGHPLADVLPNIVVLTALGLVCFVAGLWLFNRRLEA